MLNLSKKSLSGLGREFRNKNFELTEKGAYFNASRLFIGGAFGHRLEGEKREIAPNLFTAQGLNYLLGAAFDAQAQQTAFYLSLFSGNVTPAGTWTAANYVANSTEFTAYDETTRPVWARGDVANQVLSNTGTEAQFTYSTGGPYTIYGGSLLTSSVKGGSAGLLIASARFATTRTNQIAGDKLLIDYSMTAVDDGA